MRRRLARLAALAVVAVLGAAVAPAPATPRASAASAGRLSACGAGSGVLVVVDFAHWGGSVDVGCAPGHPPDGLAAMHTAGFLTAGDAANGAAFVCRIGVAVEGTGSERPTPAQDACVGTPPATAYWAFWFAAPGQDAWIPSPVGVMSYRPTPGSVEGWAFGSGGRPPVTPEQVRAEASPPPTTPPTTTPPTTTPPTTTPPSSTPPSSTASSSVAATVPSGAAATLPAGRRHGPARARRTTTSTTTSTTAPGATPTTIPTTTTSTPAHVVALPTAGRPRGQSNGTPTGVILAAVALAALAAGAGVTARRRRRAT